MAITYTGIFLVALLGGLAAKVVSLVIDGVIWFRSWAVALVAEAGKNRKTCK